MNIQTKYNVGDRVYFVNEIENNDIVIREIKLRSIIFDGDVVSYSADIPERTAKESRCGATLDEGLEILKKIMLEKIKQREDQEERSRRQDQEIKMEDERWNERRRERNEN